MKNTLMYKYWFKVNTCQYLKPCEQYKTRLGSILYKIAKRALELAPPGSLSLLEAGSKEILASLIAQVLPSKYFSFNVIKFHNKVL